MKVKEKLTTAVEKMVRIREEAKRIAAEEKERQEREKASSG